MARYPATRDDEVEANVGFDGRLMETSPGEDYFRRLYDESSSPWDRTVIYGTWPDLPDLEAHERPDGSYAVEPG